MKDNGGAAFPRAASEFTRDGTCADGNDAISEQDGMSLRDYFAAAALKAPWAQAVSQHEPAATAKDCAELAAHCYALADALMKAREK